MIRPRLDPWPYDGRIPKGERLERVVINAVTRGPQPADAVIALTDVYTGTTDFAKPRDAKRILEGKDLAVLAKVCPELKEFLNKLLTLCGGAPLP